jgi:hypothetical protein
MGSTLVYPWSKMLCSAWQPDVLKPWEPSEQEHLWREKTAGAPAASVTQCTQPPHPSALLQSMYVGKTSHPGNSVFLKQWVSLCWLCSNQFFFILSKTAVSENWPKHWKTSLLIKYSTEVCPNKREACGRDEMESPSVQIFYLILF